MIEEETKYSTAFTSGALLLRETEAYLSAIKDLKLYLAGEENIDFNVIPVNAESSKKRLHNEVKKRIKAINNENIIASFIPSDTSAKKLILFYGICKQYPIIKHFMLEIVYKKWQNLDLDIRVDDFKNFLYRKADFHPELQKITENSIYKSGQVAIKMLIDLGMVQKNKIQKTSLDHTVLREIVDANDLWYLDVLLLSDLEKKEI